MPINSSRRVELLLQQRLGLLRFIRCLVNDADVAADLFQDVGLIILRHHTGPTDEDAFRSWSRGLARNMAAHYWRAEARRSAKVARAAELLYEPAVKTTSGNPERQLELREALEASIGTLDEPARELILRRYLLGETATEVAETLRQSPAAVRMRLMRLRNVMRDPAPP
jgi:RNA polymerase sigma-70 factor (ECF subfamily)